MPTPGSGLLSTSVSIPTLTDQGHDTDILPCKTANTDGQCWCIRRLPRTPADRRQHGCVAVGHHMFCSPASCLPVQHCRGSVRLCEGYVTKDCLKRKTADACVDGVINSRHGDRPMVGGSSSGGGGDSNIKVFIAIPIAIGEPQGFHTASFHVCCGCYAMIVFMSCQLALPKTTRHGGYLPQH